MQICCSDGVDHLTVQARTDDVRWVVLVVVVRDAGRYELSEERLPADLRVRCTTRWGSKRSCGWIARVVEVGIVSCNGRSSARRGVLGCSLSCSRACYLFVCERLGWRYWMDWHVTPRCEVKCTCRRRREGAKPNAGPGSGWHHGL